MSDEEASSPDHCESPHEPNYRNLLVTNIPTSLYDDQLLTVLRPYGAQTSKIMMDTKTGNSRGFGFVYFESEECGRYAVNKLSETPLQAFGMELPLTFSPSHHEGPTTVPKKNGNMNILHVRRIPSTWSYSEFQSLLGLFAKPTFILARREKTNNYSWAAFAVYSTNQDARRVILRLHNMYPGPALSSTIFHEPNTTDPSRPTFDPVSYAADPNTASLQIICKFADRNGTALVERAQKNREGQQHPEPPPSYKAPPTTAAEPPSYDALFAHNPTNLFDTQPMLLPSPLPTTIPNTLPNPLPGNLLTQSSFAQSALTQTINQISASLLAHSSPESTTNVASSSSPIELSRHINPKLTANYSVTPIKTVPVGTEPRDGSPVIPISTSYPGTLLAMPGQQPPQMVLADAALGLAVTPMHGSLLAPGSMDSELGSSCYNPYNTSTNNASIPHHGVSLGLSQPSSLTALAPHSTVSLGAMPQSLPPILPGLPLPLLDPPLPMPPVGERMLLRPTTGIGVQPGLGEPLEMPFISNPLLTKPCSQSF